MGALSVVLGQADVGQIRDRTHREIITQNPRGPVLSRRPPSETAHIASAGLGDLLGPMKSH